MQVNLSAQEEFVENLQKNLECDYKSKEEVQSHYDKCDKLKTFIINLIEKNLKTFNMDFDVGCSTYYQAEINSDNKIIINIGADVFLEVEFTEALQILDRKLNLYSKKLFLLNEQIIKNKAYLKFTLSLIDKIKNEN